MAGKRDQLQAHRFLVQRVITALVTQEADPEHAPLRRLSRAAAGSIVLAVLIVAGWAAYGLVVPGGNRAWRTGDAVIVVKETGARYVYVDGRLHPVLNYTSALLALGRHAPTRSVSWRSLADVPRGPRIGIADAPDALPPAGEILNSGWSLCSAPDGDSVLLAGTEPAGGRPLGDTALLVAVPGGGDQYLVWHGHRHRIRAADAVPAGLALRTQARTRVGPAVVDVLPDGDPIAPIPVPDAGQPFAPLPRLRLGQVAVAGDGVQHYLVTADGLRPISVLQSDIQLAYPPTARAYPGSDPAAVPLSLTAAAGARMAGEAAASPAPAPAQRPALTGPAETVCVSYDPGETTPRVRVGAALPPAGATVPTSGRTAAGLPLAGRVFLPPGRAALVEVVAGDPAATGTLILVTDQGRGYPLAGPEVLGVLGYEGKKPARLPAGLVTRVPLGSVLDPAAARVPAAG